MTSTTPGKSEVKDIRDPSAKVHSGYHRLKATADSLAFTHWSRFFFIRGTKEFGRLAELWIPLPERNENTSLFHPTESKPMAPEVTIVQLKATMGANLRRYESICDEFFEEESWRAHVGTNTTPSMFSANLVPFGIGDTEISEPNENLFQVPLLTEQP